jgi:addiction module RelE/StbE family toxin
MRVRWTEAAIADLTEIHGYLSRNFPERAQRWVRKLIIAVEPLAQFPELGRVVPEGDGRHREVLATPYRLLYRVAGQEIVIVAVVHGSRDLGRLEANPWEVSEG